MPPSLEIASYVFHVTKTKTYLNTKPNFSCHSTEKRWCSKLRCRGRLLSARGVGSRWEGRKWAKVKGPRSAGRCWSPPFTSSGSQPWQSKSSPTRSPLQDCSPCRCVKKALTQQTGATFNVSLVQTSKTRFYKLPAARFSQTKKIKTPERL